MRPPHDFNNARSATLPGVRAPLKVALRASGDSCGGRMSYLLALRACA